MMSANTKWIIFVVTTLCGGWRQRIFDRAMAPEPIRRRKIEHGL